MSGEFLCHSKGILSTLNSSLRHLALPNQDDVSPLKALIAYQALVHPDHPLRKPGVNGIELYLGEWHTPKR